MMLNTVQHAMTRTALHLCLFAFSVSALFFHPNPTQAIPRASQAVPRPIDLQVPVESADADVLRRVYVQGVLDLPIVQQPTGKPYYVSNRSGEATQFSMVSQYGNIGLLAHNTLSGKHFSDLSIGQDVHLTYQGGRVEIFVIRQILRFQALDPESVSSSFRNVDRNEILSAGEMFNRVYVGSRRLVLQTCIEAEGNVSWGRLFVVALPRQ